MAKTHELWFTKQFQILSILYIIPEFISDTDMPNVFIGLSEVILVHEIRPFSKRKKKL